MVSSLPLRTLHRFSAFVLASFLFVHIANHVMSLHGIATHLSIMETLRKVYRLPLVEAALLMCVLFQTVSGITLVVRGWKQRRGKVAWLQAISGLYLAFFLLVHVSAVLAGRAIFNLDTNFYFAAAGIHVPPFAWFFVPYYFLAVAALFAHVGCALYWRIVQARARVAGLVLMIAIAAGLVMAALIVLSMAGVFESFSVPAEYKATYGVR
jgi:succinate dehydrogenase/fumarate reductase cytochrome b subunit